MAQIKLKDWRVINFTSDDVELTNDNSNNIKLKDWTLVKLNEQNYNKLKDYKLSKDNKVDPINKSNTQEDIKENDNNISLDEIDILIKNKKNILNLSNPWSNSNFFTADDSTVIKNTIDSLEKWRMKYNKANLDDKVFILNNMKSNYFNINNKLNKIHDDKMNKLNQLWWSIDDNLKKEFEKFDSDMISLKESISKKTNNEKKDKSNLEQWMLWTIPESNPEQVQPKQVQEDISKTNEVKNKKEEYKWREIIENKDWTFTYKSKLDDKDKTFSNMEDLMTDVNTWVQWFNDFKNKEIIEKLNNEIKKSWITDKEKIKAFKKEQLDPIRNSNILKSKWFTKIDFDNIIW